MQIITNDENKVLRIIINNREKYSEGISYDVIREILDISETEVVDILEILEKKDFIHLDSENKSVSYNNLDQEVKTVKDRSALKKYMLNRKEQEAYSIINDIIQKYDGYAPRYIIEGALLYGDLELSSKKTYNIIVSLENQKLLNKVKRTDGEYYTI